MTKPNILLDLDQTLISAESVDDFDRKKYKGKMKKFSYSDMEDYYVVFERPNLQPFLDYLFENFNVSVWTAASKDYALFIIHEIILKRKNDRKLDYIFFSYHCDISKKKKNGSKDLSMLWDIYELKGYNKDNTVILDDYNEVHLTQPSNTIIAHPFEFTSSGSENDTFLIDLQQHLHALLKKDASLCVGVINAKMKKDDDSSSDSSDDDSSIDSE